jgi:hypothetical protein
VSTPQTSKFRRGPQSELRIPAYKKISVGHKDATTFITNSVSRNSTMSDLIFHVYKDDKVKAHNLTVEELETLINSKKVKLGEDEIEMLELSKNTEGSY